MLLLWRQTAGVDQRSSLRRPSADMNIGYFSRYPAVCTVPVRGPLQLSTARRNSAAGLPAADHGSLSIGASIVVADMSHAGAMVNWALLYCPMCGCGCTGSACKVCMTHQSRLRSPASWHMTSASWKLAMFLKTGAAARACPRPQHKASLWWTSLYYG